MIKYCILRWKTKAINFLFPFSAATNTNPQNDVLTVWLWWGLWFRYRRFTGEKQPSENVTVKAPSCVNLLVTRQKVELITSEHKCMCTLLKDLASSRMSHRGVAYTTHCKRKKKRTEQRNACFNKQCQVSISRLLSLWECEDRRILSNLDLKAAASTSKF